MQRLRSLKLPRLPPAVVLDLLANKSGLTHVGFADTLVQPVVREEEEGRQNEGVFDVAAGGGTGSWHRQVGNNNRWDLPGVRVLEVGTVTPEILMTLHAPQLERLTGMADDSASAPAGGGESRRAVTLLSAGHTPDHTNSVRLRLSHDRTFQAEAIRLCAAGALRFCDSLVLEVRHSTLSRAATKEALAALCAAWRPTSSAQQLSGSSHSSLPSSRSWHSQTASSSGSDASITYYSSGRDSLGRRNEAGVIGHEWRLTLDFMSCERAALAHLPQGLTHVTLR
jgi:hypothetical protein